MALHIVNTVPGKSQDPMRPGGPFRFGLRSAGAKVLLGGLEIQAGSSAIGLTNGLPLDENFPLELQTSVSAHAVERLTPAEGGLYGGFTGDYMLLFRSSTSAFLRSVYEVTTSLPVDANIMGYFRFRKDSWELATPDWFPRPYIASPIIGLRHNQFDTGIDVFLQGGPSPGIRVCGPMQAFQSARTYDSFLPLDWPSLPYGTPMEVWIVFNVQGFLAPVSPAQAPTADVWFSAGPAFPIRLLRRVPLGALGVPITSRKGDSGTLLLGIGHGPAVSSNGLMVEDWRLFPDFKVLVDAGNARPGCGLLCAAASPSVFSAAGNRSPASNGWDLVSTTENSPLVSYGFQPGNREQSQTLRLHKISSGYSVYEKDEPTLVTQPSGFMFEALCAGKADQLDQDAFGGGLEVSDGSTLFRLAMMRGPNGNFIGLAKEGNAVRAESYYVASELDFSTPRLLRLTHDKVRARVLVDVDGSRALDLARATASLPYTASSRARMGHLLSGDTRGRFDLLRSIFCSNYYAYEASDGVLPSGAVVANQSNGGAAVVSDGLLYLTKNEFGTALTRYKYDVAASLEPSQGAWLEAKVRVESYTNRFGTLMAPLTHSGVEMQMHVGNWDVRLCLVDAGALGKYVGIVPGSGSISDLVQQTVLGKAFSTKCVWTEWQTYRIHYRPYEAIEVWVGSTAVSPQIVIPWTGSFDLPTLSPWTSGYSFGHVQGDYAGTSVWEFFRWGIPAGFDVHVEREYENAPPRSAHGGRSAYLLQAVDDDTSQPMAPTLVLEPTGTLTLFATEELAFTGTAEPFSIIRILIDGQGAEERYVGQDGLWSINHVFNDVGLISVVFRTTNIVNPNRFSDSNSIPVTVLGAITPPAQSYLINLTPDAEGYVVNKNWDAGLPDYSFIGAHEHPGPLMPSQGGVGWGLSSIQEDDGLMGSRFFKLGSGVPRILGGSGMMADERYQAKWAWRIRKSADWSSAWWSGVGVLYPWEFSYLGATVNGYNNTGISEYGHPFDFIGQHTVEIGDVVDIECEWRPRVLVGRYRIRIRLNGGAWTEWYESTIRDTYYLFQNQPYYPFGLYFNLGGPVSELDIGPIRVGGRMVFGASDIIGWQRWTLEGCVPCASNDAFSPLGGLIGAGIYSGLPAGFHNFADKFINGSIQTAGDGPWSGTSERYLLPSGARWTELRFIYSGVEKTFQGAPLNPPGSLEFGIFDGDTGLPLSIEGNNSAISGIGVEENYQHQSTEPHYHWRTVNLLGVPPTVRSLFVEVRGVQTSARALEHNPMLNAIHVGALQGPFVDGYTANGSAVLLRSDPNPGFVEADLVVPPVGYAAGIVARYQDALNWVALVIDGAGEVSLRRCVGGVVDLLPMPPLADRRFQPRPFDKVRLRLSVSGVSVTAEANRDDWSAAGEVMYAGDPGAFPASGQGGLVVLSQDGRLPVLFGRFAFTDGEDDFVNGAGLTAYTQALGTWYRR